MANINNTSNSDARFVHQIGQDFFWVEIWIYNFLAEYPPLQIPFFFINQLAIEENLSNWVTKGFLVLENDYEILERGAPAYVASSNDSSADNSNGYKAPYLFRNDGRNRLSVKIYPYKAKEGDISDDLPPPEWQMNYDFIIYDIQDISENEPGKKLRAYYFKDERHQVFSERCLEWSTSMYSPLGAKDIERTMYGNDAIKSLISAAATVGGKHLKIGYDDGASIEAPNIPLDTFGSWAPAPTDPESKIFYNSPGHHCVMDDLNYLLKNTKSSDNSPVLLSLNRYDKSWELTSINSIFKNAEKNQIEHLLINDGADPTNSPPSIPRANGGNSSPIHNFISGTASTITNYHYSPMVTNDDNLICNSPLINYNFSKTTYNVFFEKNKVTNVLDSMQKIGQSGLFNMSNNSNGQIIMNINPTKQNGVMNKNCFTPQSFFLKDMPLMQMIKDMVFLSGGLYFQTLGLTVRSPGKFVFIDRLVSGKNSFDDKFLGQWLITKVTHFFTKAQYMNDVVATKIDAYSKIFPDVKKDKSY